MAHFGGSSRVRRMSFRPVLARLCRAAMPLTLITGPANAAKAGAVLERLRASLSREPVLVVPTSADETSLRPRARRRGARIRRRRDDLPTSDPRLARQAGVRGRPLGGLSRGRWCGRRSATFQLRELAASAASPGFPGRSWRTCSPSCSAHWRGRRGSARPPRLARGRDRAAARRRARGALLRLPPAAGGAGAVDADGLARSRSTGCATRGTAGRCCSTASTTCPAQLDLVETLVRHTDTEVTVAVTYEPGRAAMAGSATTVELLKPLAREHLDAGAAFRALRPSARGALHHLERELFEDAPGSRRSPTARCDCSRRAASAPRLNSPAPPCSNSCATGWHRRTSRYSCAFERRSCSPRSSNLPDPRGPRAPRPVRPHPPRRRPAGLRPRRARREARRWTS